MTGDWMADTRTSYDGVASSYAEMFRHYPDDDPHDRAVFRLFAELVQRSGGGSVADVGCGPGHVTAHLRGLGLDAFGIDLSPGMVEQARRDHAGLQFDVGSMTSLDVPDGSLGGYLAWYSLIHVPDEEVPGVLTLAARALRPGGVALLGFHVGDELRLVTTAYGGDHPMHCHAQRRPLEQVAAWLLDAGFVVDTHILQDPAGAPPQGRLLAHRP